MKQSLFKTKSGENYIFPFILVTSLFLIWGFAHSLLDVLNKHFQNVLEISRAKSGWVQAAVYGGYFIAAIPAGLFMKKYGFKKGILLGLFLVAIGSFLFIPAASIGKFEAFLMALFVIAFGLACLETAANPYTTVLGPSETSERRINLSQSFNALGWVIGPLVGSLIILSASKGEEFSSLMIPYLGLGIVVLLVAVLFTRTHLPEITGEVSLHGEESGGMTGKLSKPLFAHHHFVFAIFAQFFYVAGQTGINSFFINYVTEVIPSISDQKAGLILAFGGMGMFWLGRITGSYFMKFLKPNLLLSIYAAINVLLMFIVVMQLGWISVIALFSTYFFMSVMFPTIFAMGIKNLGEETKKASSYIVMAIVGGAICPMLMGYIADTYNMAIGFTIPLVCFALVMLYGTNGYKIRN